MTKGIFAGLCCAALISVPVMAENQCAGETASVSGWVKTINLGQITQTGFIHLRIKPKGKPFFDETGAIVGEVVEKNAFGLPAKLDHHMYFGQLVHLNTSDDTVISAVPTGDVADLDGDNVPEPCAFYITEKITEAQGTRKLSALSNGNHEIVAKGTVSYCPGNNQNNFELSGTVCID